MHSLQAQITGLGSRAEALQQQLTSAEEACRKERQGALEAQVNSLSTCYPAQLEQRCWSCRNMATRSSHGSRVLCVQYLQRWGRTLPAWSVGCMCHAICITRQQSACVAAPMTQQI